MKIKIIKKPIRIKFRNTLGRTVSFKAIKITQKKIGFSENQKKVYNKACNRKMKSLKEEK